MKPKQTLLFILLNIIGYSTIALAIFFYIAKKIELSVVLLVIGIIIIIISFRIGLKVTNPITSSNDDNIVYDELENELVPISSIVADEEFSDQLITEEAFDLQPTPIEDNNIIEVLSHYSNYEDSKDPNILCTHVDTIEMLEINLKNLSDKMDTYGLIKKNPLFNYRFESLLKLGVTDTKIWENLYSTIPYVDIVEQNIETMNRKVYLVRASINERSKINIGYLPLNVNINLENIHTIEGTLIGGKYNYLNNEDSSFNTFESPLKLHIRIQIK